MDAFDFSDDEHGGDPVVAPEGQGLESVSVGEAASNIVHTGTGPSGSTPADSTPTNSTRSGSKRLRTSWVWKHMSIVEHFKDANGIDIGARAACNYCGTHYTCVSDTGTGPHGRHLRNKHPDKIVSGESASSLKDFVYTKEKMRDGLAHYVAAAEQPFTFGDDIRFEYFMQNCVNLAFGKVSRNTTRSDTMKAYNEVRKDLICELAKLGAIAFGKRSL
jgi:hypothetical protein